MRFSELFVQGVRQFSEMRRLGFDADYTAIYSSPDGRADVLYKVLRALLFTSDTQGTRLDLVEPGSSSCRAAVTIVGRDKRNYRLLRDFLSGAVSLTVDDGQGGFSVLSGSGGEIAQLLRAQVGIPSSDLYDTLFTCGLSEMPSRQVTNSMPGVDTRLAPSVESPVVGAFAPVPAQSLGTPADALPPSAQAARMPLVAAVPEAIPNSPFSHLSVEQKRAKLDELRQTLRAHQEVRDLEFELDGLQRRKFELQDLLRPLRDIEEQREDANKALEKWQRLADVPQDFIDKLEWFRAEQKRRDDNIRTLENEHHQNRTNTGAGALEPLHKDQLFVGGLVGGVAAFVFGSVLARSVDPGLWKIALLDIVGFGAAAWALMRRIANLEEGSDTKRAQSKLDERIDRVLKRFELDTVEVRKVLSKHEVELDKLDAFEVLIMERMRAQQSVADVDEQLREKSANLGFDLPAVSTELTLLEQQTAAMEEKLASYGATPIDALEIANHVTLLERELGLRFEGRGSLSAGSDEYGYGGGSTSSDNSGGQQFSSGESRPEPLLMMSGFGQGFDGGAGDYDATDSSAVGGGDTVVSDVTRTMMQLGSELFGLSIDALGTQISARVAQYLGAFTDKRFMQVQFGARGEMLVVEAASNRAMPFFMLQAADRDLVSFALRFTLLEAQARQHPMPVIINDAFVALAELKHPLVAKVLGYLGSLTQVIHFTSDQKLAAQASHRIVL